MTKKKKRNKNGQRHWQEDDKRQEMPLNCGSWKADG